MLAGRVDTLLILLCISRDNNKIPVSVSLFPYKLPDYPCGIFRLVKQCRSGAYRYIAACFRRRIFCACHHSLKRFYVFGYICAGTENKRHILFNIIFFSRPSDTFNQFSDICVNVIFLIKRRVVRKGENDIVSLRHNTLDYFHLLTGKALERIKKDCFTAEVAVFPELFVQLCEIIGRVHKLLAHKRVKRFVNKRCIGQFEPQSIACRCVRRLTQIFGSNSVYLEFSYCVKNCFRKINRAAVF